MNQNDVERALECPKDNQFHVSFQDSDVDAPMWRDRLAEAVVSYLNSERFFDLVEDHLNERPDSQSPSLCATVTRLAKRKLRSRIDGLHRFKSCIQYETGLRLQEEDGVLIDMQHDLSSELWTLLRQDLTEYLRDHGHHYHGLQVKTPYFLPTTH